MQLVLNVRFVVTLSNTYSAAMPRQQFFGSRNSGTNQLPSSTTLRNCPHFLLSCYMDRLPPDRPLNRLFQAFYALITPGVTTTTTTPAAAASTPAPSPAAASQYVGVIAIVATVNGSLSEIALRGLFFCPRRNCRFHRGL